MANNSDMVDSLADKISSLFTSATGSSQFKDDAQRNLRAVIQSAFSKLDIVSREEFDAQVAVLHRTREKVEQLEQQLAAISEQLNKSQS